MRDAGMYSCEASNGRSLATAATHIAIKTKAIHILASCKGEFQEKADAKWIVNRGPLWGHNDTPCGRPTPGRPVGRPGAGRPQGVFAGLSYF
jgi:hypothetical protein